MAEPARRPGTRDALAAFRHRNFRVFWFGALLSNTGSWLQNTTIPFVVYRLTGSAAWVGAVAFLQFVPIVVLGPVAGAIADRYARRTVLLVTQSALALLALGFWGVWLSDRASLGAIVVLVVLSGIVAGLNLPAWQAFVSELVPRDDLLNAVTLNSLQFNASRAFGPALGGLVLGIGVGWAFLANALSYVAVIVALAMVRLVAPVRDRRHGSVLTDFRDAVRFTHRLPGVRTCFAVVVALGLLGGPLFQLLVVFADEVFGVDDQLYGLLGAALGIGAIVAAPFVAGRGSGLPRSTLLGGAVVAYGVAVTAFALAPVFPMAVVALMVAGGAYLAIASTLNTTIQLQVPEVLRGKVLAVYLMLLTAAMPVGALVQGFLVQAVGPRPVVAVAGATFAGLALWLRWGSDRLATVDDEGLRSVDDPGPDAHAASVHSDSQARPVAQSEAMGHQRQA